MTTTFRAVTYSLCLAAALTRTARAQTALDSLVDADHARSDAGFAALIAHAASDLVLVYPGAPVIAGRDAAVRLIDAQPALRRLTVRWVPLHGEVSSDGSFGITYGVTAISDSAGTLRFGKYLSAWRRGPGGWELVAHAPIGLLPAAAYTAPPGWQPGTPAIAPLAADFAVADSLFAAQAGRAGAEAAFAAWIAPDGVMFAGSGEVIRGADAPHRLLAGNQAAWRWRAVAAFGTHDLGITVGEAEISPPNGSPFYSHYLTQWRRQSGGAIRFIADGGSARPTPTR